MWSKDQFNKSIFITQFCNMLNIELQTDNHRDVIYDQVLIFIIVMEIIWNILNNALLADYFYIICIASSISHITGELRHMYIYCTVYIVSIRITSVHGNSFTRESFKSRSVSLVLQKDYGRNCYRMKFSG